MSDKSDVALPQYDTCTASLILQNRYAIENHKVNAKNICLQRSEEIISAQHNFFREI